MTLRPVEIRSGKPPEAAGEGGDARTGAPAGGADAVSLLAQAAVRRTTAFPAAPHPGKLVWHEWGAGRPLVLFHGGAGSWRHWIRTIPAFMHSRRVVAVDLPGLGESAAPPEPYGPGSVAEIVAGGLAEILAGERCDLVGFSFGAMIAGHVAALAPELVRSLTLVGAGGLGAPRNGIVLERVRSKSGQARIDAHRANLARLMFADPSRIDALALAIQDWNSRHARINSVPFATGSSLLDALAGVTCPVHAVWGEHDAPAWPELAQRQQVLKAARPEAMIHTVPGAGHWVMYEAAETFNGLLAEFLHAHDDTRGTAPREDGGPDPGGAL